MSLSWCVVVTPTLVAPLVTMFPGRDTATTTRLPVAVSVIDSVNVSPLVPYVPLDAAPAWELLAPVSTCGTISYSPCVVLLRVAVTVIEPGALV